MSSDSRIDEQLEMLKALIELRVIKRDGMELFFELEDALGELGSLYRELDVGNKTEQLIAKRVQTVFLSISRHIYELQALINRGDL